MKKKKVVRFGLPIIFLLLMMGCVFINEYWSELTTSASGSIISSSSVSTSNLGSNTPQQTHRHATVNLLERSPFKGKKLDPTFWNNLEAYCQAGPTKLIIADMTHIPGHMTRAGFTGRANAQYYALSRIVESANWSAGNDPDLLFLKGVQSEIDNFWYQYVQRIVQIMKKAPKTFAVLIANDDEA